MKRLTYSLTLASLCGTVGCSHWSPIVGDWSQEGLKSGESFYIFFDKGGNYTLGGYVGGDDYRDLGTYTLSGVDLTLDDHYSKPTVETVKWLGPNEIEIDSTGSPVRYTRS